MSFNNSFKPVLAASALISTIVFSTTASASIFVSGYETGTDTLKTGGASRDGEETLTGTIDSNGVAKVPSGAPRDGNNNDPRAETFFTKTFAPGSTGDFSFEASVFITNARKTTFTQILNSDPDLPDSSKPVMFLSATLKPDGTVFVCNGNASNETSCAPRIYWSGLGQFFKVRIEGDGKFAHVYIDDELADNVVNKPSSQEDPTIYTSDGLDLQTTTQVKPASNAISRTTGNNRLRFGAYHHDVLKEDDNVYRAQSPAQVRVYNIKQSGF